MSPNRSDPSPRQRDVLSFINSFRSKEQCNPTHVEIQKHFGWASPNAATDHLKALARKGIIRPRFTGTLHLRARGYIVGAFWSHVGA